MKQQSRGEGQACKLHACGIVPYRDRPGTKMTTATSENPELRVVDSSLMMKVFYAFALLAAVSVAISLTGKWIGHSIAMAGYTDDATPYEIVIGNNVIVAPANMIRFEQSRRDGIASRLDLYLRYPQMDGYSRDARDDFNGTDGRRTVLFLSFEPQTMSRDMSGRFEPIYSQLIEKQGAPGPAGTTVYKFIRKSGYLDETLVVGDRPGTMPFVARCLTGEAAAQSLAPCERDVLVGDELSLTYRFPEAFLANWQALDKAVAAKAESLLKTTPGASK